MRYEEKYNKLHDKLKSWLIKLGGKNRYNSKSGDNQPIDIRLKTGHTEYAPDVIWAWDGKKLIIELAFNEDWRSVVGEACLCSMMEDCKKIIIFASVQDAKEEEFYTKLSTLLDNKYRGRELRYGVYIVPVDLELIRQKKINKIKKIIFDNLKKKWQKSLKMV